MEPVYSVAVDPEAKTIRPTTEGGDDYYGLGPGTNGTAAICRRACVDLPGYRWVRSSGRSATGINYVVVGGAELESVQDGES